LFLKDLKSIEIIEEYFGVRTFKCNSI